MNIQIEQTETISGTVTPPSSKSHTVRALLLATMARGTSTLLNALASDDTDQAVEVCRDLGVTVRVLPQPDHRIDMEVDSKGLPLRPIIRTLFTGNSGITTRFVLPMLGLCVPPSTSSWPRPRTERGSPKVAGSGFWSTAKAGQASQNDRPAMTIDCGDQMRQRPVRPLIDALNHLGMTIDSIQKNDSCPLSCDGSLQGGSATVDGITSQYCSALLLSLPCAPQDSVITVTDLHERPYVEMTTRWLDEQQIRYRWEREGGMDRFHVMGGQRYQPFIKMIPGDFSSASYLIAAGVLRGGEVVLNGLDMNDAQGDKRLIPIFQEMGADITINKQDIIVRGGRDLAGMTIDCNDVPDLVPTLALIATQAHGVTRLVNVGQARLKETDRLHSMCSELTKMGAAISEESDGLIIHRSALRGTDLHGYSDHRTIMALAVAGLVAEGTTTIDTAEGINKTFPNFVSIMQSLGAQIKII